MKKTLFILFLYSIFLLNSIYLLAQEADDYAFSTNTNSSFADMSNSKTLLEADLLQKSSAVTPLGFEMWFMGVRYTDFSVNTNGVIQLGKNGILVGANAYNIANTPRIVPFTSGQQPDGIGNWKTAIDGKIHYITQGISPNRIVIIEATNLLVNHMITDGTATFQIWLYETAPLPATTKGGKIEFRYNKMQCGVDEIPVRIGLGSSDTRNKFKGVDISTNPPTAKITDNTIENTIKKGNIPNLHSTNGINLRIFSFESPEPNGQCSNLKGASPAGTEVVLNWDENASNEVGSVIYKSLNGKDFEFLTQVNGATTYTDKDVKPCITYYYRVYTVTEGKLGVLQATGSLTYQVTLPLSIDIKGILFSCATNPASAKEIEAVDEKKSFEKFYWVNSNKDTVGREQTFKLIMAGNYQLVGKTKDGCTATKNFTVTECCEVDFAVPTAFTPFSTSFNNLFLAKAENVIKFELKIYNRWGLLVFSATNPVQAWDGTFYGEPLQAGAYQVVIQYSGCKEGKTLYETSMSVLYLID